jgi:superfamily II DNA or RNA helicase
MSQQWKRRKMIAMRAKAAEKKVLELSEEYKETIRNNSYLGKKGYTILRSSISEDDQKVLYEELNVKPITSGVVYNAAQDQGQFPVYRENAKKIYIPRFYGTERYGLPNRSEITEGQDIDVIFPKPLRDYQDKIVDVYMKHIEKSICNGSGKKGNGGILEVPCGRGKTVMALKIISLVKKKTLIIVHKEFLMNQWIERAAEFLPSAKIGKIQGPVFDVEGKDVVIGMLQTLYDRALPENAFDCFGLTIIDEVHRIGSEQFSKTLLRVVSPNMLGISATVDRKDKLTCVLYMFIGPKIYTEARKDEDPVCVRALEYIAADPQFNETEYDFKGQAKYSTMITKLCEFGPRSDFIVKTLADLLVESKENNEDAQIMVLAHNRSLLKYFYEAINHKGFATVGYYVGGMKQADLQETEYKQIVLATYAMAAEALDIKTLSILVMATPKTDITQSVGRILRVRHDNPIVVDIVDRHEIFQNQWKQRRRFYKKCNYRIIATDSIRYKGMNIDWKNDKTWNRVFDPKINKNNNDDEGTGGNPILQKKCLINISNLDMGD